MKEEKTEIVVTGAASLDDVHKFIRYYHLRLRRKFYLIYSSIMMVLMSFLIYHAFKNSSTSPQRAFSLTIFSIGLGLTVAMIIIPILIKKRTKTVYKLDPTLSTEARYIADDKGIKIEMINDVERFYEWNSTLKSYEFSDMFLIYVNSLLLIFLPKSFFETQEDIDEFRKLLSQKTKKSKR